MAASLGRAKAERPRERRSVFALALACAFAGCGSEGPAPLAPLALPDGCQPLAAPSSCTLPWPSDFYREPDPAMPSGARYVVRGAAEPKTLNDADADVTGPFAPDGASLAPTITGVLPALLVSDGLPNVVDDGTKSVDVGASPTLLFRADDMTPIAHYADVDPKATDEKTALSLRPFAPLEPKTRYVVAIRRARTESGVAPAAEGFRRLRDGETSRDPALAALAPRFERDVLAPLAAKGVARGELQLAWDFTTGTRERSTHDLLRVRELTLAWLKDHEPKVTVTASEPGTGDYWRELRGTIEGPRFVESDLPGATLHRGPDGEVAENGTATWEFLVAVPNSVRDAYDPGRALAFGHGFFGGRDEVEGGASKAIVQKVGAVAIGIDWWGMSKPDLDAVIADVTGDTAHTGDFVERVHQAMANWLVTTAALRGPMTKLAELRRPNSGQGTSEQNGVSNAGALLYDPAHVFYFGASQAHILGATMCALNPDVERAVLDVGGAALTHVMPRSNAFAAFQFILKSAIGDELTVQAVLAMLATELDRIDPATYAPYLIGSKLPGNPDRKVLLQVGIGDSSVPAIAGFWHARALGLAQTAPPVAPIFGLPAADASTLTSAITVWDFGIPMDVYREPTSRPDNEVHVGLRSEPTALAQTEAFLRTDGKVIHPCPGACKVR
jgi:hypothetical protein